MTRCWKRLWGRRWIGPRAQIPLWAQARRAARLLSRPCLEERLRWELPPSPEGVRRYPLGVLLHVGAGNMEGLPAYSAVEGLLAGNINLLKLPENDNGISSFLLRRLAAIEPRLRPYLYVFRISSADQAAMKRLAGLADGIAVWGGDRGGPGSPGTGRAVGKADRVGTQNQLRLCDA